MIHLNKKTEYALLAIEHMIRKPEKELTSTREISETYRIPYALLAKVMQKLASHGLIKSVQGTRGGYILAKRPQDISVIHVMEIFDGSFAFAECFKDAKITCAQWSACLIRHPLYEINHKIYRLLAETTLADLGSKKPYLNSAAQV